jgi:multiple sugar transport system ATP-binding protein
VANVSFKHITKSFGQVTAVDDVSFDIHDGEFICLLGPSGCGKTTSLRMIAGLEPPTSGQIIIGGKDVTKTPPKDRDIGMVFQDYALYPHMTIADNITYPLKVRGASAEERRRRAEEVAKSLQIVHLLDRRPGQISGGQQQRTSVARAVVHKPQVFLFDEPLSNLDAKLRLEARSFLKHLQQSLGVTAVYVTHDQAEAMALADRIAVMENGKIVQMGPPLAVYRKPATTFVANFLGSPPMNLLPVTLEKSASQLWLKGHDFTLDASTFAVLLTPYPDGTTLTLGVRPEHLTLVPGKTPWTVTGQMYATEPLGPETLVTVSVDNTLVTARIFGDEPPEAAGEVLLALRPEHLHLFDSEGLRLES